MAITQEQYDKFEDGDTITVAIKDGLFWTVKTTEIKVEGVDGANHRWLTNHNQSKYAEPKTSMGWNLVPELGGKHFTLLEHKPKPKPAWHSARVIQGSDGALYLKHTVDKDMWIRDNAGQFSTQRIADLYENPEIVVA